MRFGIDLHPTVCPPRCSVAQPWRTLNQLNGATTAECPQMIRDSEEFCVSTLNRDRWKFSIPFQTRHQRTMPTTTSLRNLNKKSKTQIVIRNYLPREDENPKIEKVIWNLDKCSSLKGNIRENLSLLSSCFMLFSFFRKILFSCVC